jgi:glycine/serine hydroxymethyltransferase
MRTIAGWIGDVLAAPDDAKSHASIRAQVTELARQFPAPAEA